MSMKKIPVTPVGIEPATFRLVAQFSARSAKRKFLAEYPLLLWHRDTSQDR
jgi:hypothetical protein